MSSTFIGLRLPYSGWSPVHGCFEHYNKSLDVRKGGVLFSWMFCVSKLEYMLPISYKVAVVCHKRFCNLLQKSSKNKNNNNNNSVALVRERTIPTERQPFVGEVSSKFCAMHSHFRIHDFLDRSRYYFFYVAPHLYLTRLSALIPDLLLLRKSGSVGNWTRTSESVARSSDH
jgi:hypothetical protein